MLATDAILNGISKFPSLISFERECCCTWTPVLLIRKPICCHTQHLAESYVPSAPSSVIGLKVIISTTHIRAGDMSFIPCLPLYRLLFSPKMSVSIGISGITWDPTRTIQRRKTRSIRQRRHLTAIMVYIFLYLKWFFFIWWKLFSGSETNHKHWFLLDLIYFVIKYTCVCVCVNSFSHIYSIGR